MATPAGPGTTNDAASSRNPPTPSPPVGRRTPSRQSTSRPSKGHPFDPRTPVPTREPRVHNTPPEQRRPSRTNRAQPPHGTPARTHTHQKSLLLSTPAAVPNPRLQQRLRAPPVTGGALGAVREEPYFAAPPMWCTRSMFVVPATPGGEPAV